VMRGLAIGPWRFLAPGLKISRVTATERETNLFMLRAAPGISLFEHGHTGDEYICVLKGAFADQGGLYTPGDIAVADTGVAHQPRVEKDGECICLVALDGKLKLKSLIGRALQPIFGL
jgi:putative transcriptional regulator